MTCARQWHCFSVTDKDSLSQADGSELYMESVNDSRTEHKATAFADDWFEFPAAREIICNI